MMSRTLRLVAIGALVYMAYGNVRMLSEIPVAQWEVVQWLMALLTVGLVAAAGLTGWRLWADKKKEAAAKAEEQAQVPIYTVDIEAPESEPEYRGENEALQNSMQDKEGRAMERELAELDRLDNLRDCEILGMHTELVRETESQKQKTDAEK